MPPVSLTARWIARRPSPKTSLTWPPTGVLVRGFPFSSRALFRVAKGVQFSREMAVPLSVFSILHPESPRPVFSTCRSSKGTGFPLNVFVKETFRHSFTDFFKNPAENWFLFPAFPSAFFPHSFFHVCGKIPSATMVVKPPLDLYCSSLTANLVLGVPKPVAPSSLCWVLMGGECYEPSSSPISLPVSFTTKLRVSPQIFSHESLNERALGLMATLFSASPPPPFLPSKNLKGKNVMIDCLVHRTPFRRPPYVPRRFCPPPTLAIGFLLRPTDTKDLGFYSHPPHQAS